MQNHDYTQKASSPKAVKEAMGESFTHAQNTSERKKFATQMDVELLRRLRAYAKSEGRQIQSVLEEAVELLLQEKQGYVMQSNVRAAYEASLDEFDDLYERLAQ